MINFGDEHSTVIGRTRSGKTYASKLSLAKVDRAVLFFNVQHEKMPKEFTTATPKNTVDQILNSLKDGRKINFLPSTHLKAANVELELLIERLYDGSTHDMYLVVDECHLFEKEALEQMKRVATTGNRWGIHGIWISQRPANIDKTLVTQSTQMVLFDTNMEVQYFKRYNVPFEEVATRIEQGGKYSYCLFDGKHVHGAFKVS